MIPKSKLMATKSRQSEFIRWMPAVVECLKKTGGTARPRDVYAWIAKEYNLSDDVLDIQLKSGQNQFKNQVAWARQYLVWEGLLDSSKRGLWTLSAEGWKVTLSDDDSSRIATRQARSFNKSQEASEDNLATTKELLTSGIELPAPPEELQELLLLDVLKKISPKGFELVCQRLLTESGFENVVVTGRSHDGGIDGYGLLRINPFVSIKVVFQCKRYKGTVSRAEIGDFRNAMLGRAEKGIFITTGTFSNDASKEASRDGAPPIELVDGDRLVELFEEAKLGVIPKTVFEIDHGFFTQFENA